jgi:hypothetical protein
MSIDAALQDIETAQAAAVAATPDGLTLLEMGPMVDATSSLVVDAVPAGVGICIANVSRQANLDVDGFDVRRDRFTWYGTDVSDALNDDLMQSVAALTAAMWDVNSVTEVNEKFRQWFQVVSTPGVTVEIANSLLFGGMPPEGVSLLTDTLDSLGLNFFSELEAWRSAPATLNLFENLLELVKLERRVRIELETDYLPRVQADPGYVVQLAPQDASGPDDGIIRFVVGLNPAQGVEFWSERAQYIQTAMLYLNQMAGQTKIKLVGLGRIFRSSLDSSLSELPANVATWATNGAMDALAAAYEAAIDRFEKASAGQIAGLILGLIGVGLGVALLNRGFGSR